MDFYKNDVFLHEIYRKNLLFWIIYIKFRHLGKFSFKIAKKLVPEYIG